MADEQKEPKRCKELMERFTQIVGSSRTVPMNISMRIYVLSVSLCYQETTLENYIHLYKDETFGNKGAAIKLYQFRNRFKEFLSPGVVHFRQLHLLRYKLFLHLYRILLKYGPDHETRQIYLQFCYKLFDDEKPESMDSDETLKYREEFIDRLNDLAQRIINLNEEPVKCSKSVARPVLKVLMKPKHIRNLPIKIKIMGFTCCYAETRSVYNLIGFRWEQEHAKIMEIPNNVDVDESIEVLERIEEEETLESLYIFHWNLPEETQEQQQRLMQFMSYKYEEANNQPNNSDCFWLFDEEEEEPKIYEITYEKLDKEQQTERTLLHNRAVQTVSSRLIAAEMMAKNPDMNESINLSTPTVSSAVIVAGINAENPDENELNIESMGPSIQEVQAVSSTVIAVEINEEYPDKNDMINPSIQEAPTVSSTVITVELIEENPDENVLNIASGRPPTEYQYSAAQHPIEEEPSHSRWQHQRHTIAAPSAIIEQFKCNPAYQCPRNEQNAANFYEQLAQFLEIMGPHSGCNECLIDVNSVKARIKLLVRRLRDVWSAHPEICLKKISRIKLKDVLTVKEEEIYETLLWYHCDRGDYIQLNDVERIRDALHGMLGYECQQLRLSSLKSRLLLRSPHHQQSISDSYLLLALGQIGYYYRRLQQQRKRLAEMGETGLALVPCLLAELGVLYKFYEKQQVHPERMMFLYRRTRSYQLRYQWLLQACEALDAPLLKSLYQQLGQGNAACDALLQLWLICATKPLLVKLSKWLLSGELPEEQCNEFFIMEHDKDAVHLDRYWQTQFELIESDLPPFLNTYLSQLVLSTGRSHQYCKEFLRIELYTSIKPSDLQPQLSAACAQFYQQLDEQPLTELIWSLHQETSKALMQQLQQLNPKPLELLGKLHQYLLLSDGTFAKQLIELLEPALEQPAVCYEAHQLNTTLEQILGKHNSALYVSKSSNMGTQCWSRFLLCWKLPLYWRALLGDRIERYESFFECFWPIHYANYMISERIKRQQTHFRERINMEHMNEVRSVRALFDQIIGKMSKFMHSLKNYIQMDVLTCAFEGFYYSCKATQTLDDMLQFHAEYLDTIEAGVFRSRKRSQSKYHLGQIFNMIIKLEAEHQKLIANCQLFAKCLHNFGPTYQYNRRHEFRRACERTTDILNDLEKRFELALVNFLISLHYTGERNLVALAIKLDSTGEYASRYEHLREVHTFGFKKKTNKRRTSKVSETI